MIFIENLMLSDFLSVLSFHPFAIRNCSKSSIIFKIICPFHIENVCLSPLLLGDTDKQRTEDEKVSESHSVLSVDEKETDNKGMFWSKYFV